MTHYYDGFTQGACQSYRPTYLKLAKDLKDMVGDDIEVYAISCVAHKDICDDFSLDDIPLVGLLPGGASDPTRMRKLKYKEKHPKFIVPFLLPDLDVSTLSETQRALLGAEESVDEQDAGDEEEDDNDDVAVEAPIGKEEEKDDDDTPSVAAAKRDETEDREGEDDDKPVDIPIKGGDGKDDDDTAPAGALEANKDNDREEAPRGDDEDEDESENESENNNQEDGNPAAVVEDAEFLEDVEEANKDWEENFPQKGDNEKTLPLMKMLGPGGVKEGAGATMKRDEASGMDRFASAIAKQRDGVQNDYLDSNNVGSGITEDGGSIAMKAHKPGTYEYAERRKKVQEHIDSLLKKKKLRTAFPAKEKVFSGGAGGASRMAIPFKKVVQKRETIHRIIGKIPFAKKLVVLSAEEELIIDATLSFAAALKMGVFTDKNPLSNTKKDALQGWLDLATVALPPEWGLHELIQELDKQFDVATRSDANLQSAIRRHESSRKEWSHSCTSQGAKNGFNCGFWKLLHVMTIGIAEHRGGLNLVEGGLLSEQARKFSPAEAAEAMKEFIRYFFPCSPCRDHFVAQYNDCSNQRCVRLTDKLHDATNPDWMELSKWLWEVHNDVNVRLLKERRDGKELSGHDEVQVLFPPLHDCTRCFKADGSHNEDAIFLYLEKEYW